MFSDCVPLSRSCLVFHVWEALKRSGSMVIVGAATTAAQAGLSDKHLVTEVPSIPDQHAFPKGIPAIQALHDLCSLFIIALELYLL